MTAAEIRAVKLKLEKRETEDGPLEFSPDLNLKKFEMLREIAAQLADLNARLARWDSKDGKHALDTRKVTFDEDEKPRE